MPHTPAEKKRALARVRRIRGQLDALESALEQGVECGPVLQQLAAVRGAVNGLMSSVLESHLREEFSSPPHPHAPEQRNIDDIISLMRTYFR